MPTRFESTEVTCAASVPAANPTEVALPFNGGILRHFEIVIPAGHSGLTGISLGYGHTGVIPYGALAFFSGDDDVLRLDYTDTVPGVTWSAFMCNNDLQLHTWQVRMAFDEITDTTPAVSAPIAPADILATGAQAMMVA